MTTERTGELSLARAVIYRFFSRCFSYPDGELLGLLSGPGAGEYLDAWAYIGFDACEELAQVTSWPEELSTEDMVLELGKEYTRLFINAVPRIPAPPYSSVYLDRDGLVWGESTSRVARLYEAAGLSIAESFGDIPDHISAELEFASYLVLEEWKCRENAPGRAEELTSIEKEFLAEHLLRWAGVFLSRVIEHSNLAFYRTLSSLAIQFIEGEIKRFGKESEDD